MKKKYVLAILSLMFLPFFVFAQEYWSYNIVPSSLDMRTNPMTLNQLREIDPKEQYEIEIEHDAEYVKLKILDSVEESIIIYHFKIDESSKTAGLETIILRSKDEPEIVDEDITIEDSVLYLMILGLVGK